MTSIEIYSEKALRLKGKILTVALGLILLITATVPKCQAQTFAEWFKQKKTQQKYLLQQISALQVYIGYAKKGYEIAGSGLQTIRDITDGEFGLHDVFITGLKKVSPAIRNDLRMAEIIALQIAIIRSFNVVKKAAPLSADQLGNMALVADQVISECYNDLEELLLVITSGKVEMTDDQRLERLNGIYDRMVDKSAFAQDFCAKMSLLILQQKNEQNSINQFRRYYEIK